MTYVEGTDKDGAAVTRNHPVLIGGVDASSNVQTLLVGTDGSITTSGGAATIADGANVAEGATTDAAVTTNATGTISGKLRGVVALLAAALPTARGQQTMANSMGVVLASNQASIPVATTPTAASTATLSNVASSATSVTVLAANAARLGATVVNDSTAILYVKFGTTASATSYTIALGPAGTVGSYYEVPFGYTGRIDGIWASANGNARVTEITA